MAAPRIDFLSLAIGAAIGAFVVKKYVEAHKAELIRDALAEKVKDAVNPKDAK